MSCSSSPTPRDIVESYYKAMQNEDYETALSYTTVTNPQDIKLQVDLYQSMNTKVTYYEILSEEIAEDGNTAVISVKQDCSYAGGFSDETTMDLQLIKQGDKWVIKM